MNHISEERCAVWLNRAIWIPRIKCTQDTIDTSINALNLSRNKLHIGINWPFICSFIYWQNCIFSTEEYRSIQVVLHFICFDSNFVSKYFIEFSCSHRIPGWTLRTHLVLAAAVSSATVTREGVGKHTLPMPGSCLGIFNSIGSGQWILYRMDD